MWKCVSRSVKTFRRIVLKKNTVLSTNALQNEELHCILKFIPTVFNRCTSFSNGCRSRCEYFSKEKDKEGPKEKKTSFLGDLENYFVEWRGLIVIVGSYGVYCVHKKIFGVSDPYQEERFPRITGYHRALEYLIDTLGFKPYRSVFPEVQASKSDQGKEKLVESAKEKCQEANFSVLEEAHQKVLGGLSNWLGVQCMQSGYPKEALKYFLQSAEEEHAPGIFNLGLCHEKGYGTSQNFKRAAELYQRASDLGHPTAMYNLGVFYAQGLGGIPLDTDHARELFKAAAHLGQADAIRALNLEKGTAEELPHTVLDSKSEVKEGNKITLSQLILDKFFDESSSQSERHFKVCNTQLNTECESFGYKKGRDSSLGSDSGVLDFSSHSEAYVLLV